jgi:hypothetical protein
MNPATLNDQTVTIGPMGGGLFLSYDENDRRLWIAPDSLYPPDTDLTLAISAGATDLAGNGLEPFSVGFSTGSFECAFLEDRFEPNDQLSAPLQVQPDSLVVGLSTCMEDVDHFRVTLQEPAKVTATTFVTYAENESWGIHWLRENGDWYATLGTRANTGAVKSFQFTFLPGSYLLKVFGNSEEPLVLYDLLLETGEPCTDDGYEDNDFQDEAASVSPGTLAGLQGCYLDHDWFSFPVSAGQTITLSVDPGDHTGTRRLAIYEPGGTWAVETDRESLTSITLLATADGTASIYALYWAEVVPYDMTIDVGTD